MNSYSNCSLSNRKNEKIMYFIGTVYCRSSRSFLKACSVGTENSCSCTIGKFFYFFGFLEDVFHGEGEAQSFSHKFGCQRYGLHSCRAETLLFGRRDPLIWD